MKYKIFNSLQEAQLESQQEAQRRGCRGITTHWWSWITHDDGRAALVSSDNESFTDVLDDSWFEQPESL